jgi:hypothetical protein
VYTVLLQLNASAMGESELMQLLRDKDGALLAMTESARALERAVAEAKVTLLIIVYYDTFILHRVKSCHLLDNKIAALVIYCSLQRG